MTRAADLIAVEEARKDPLLIPLEVIEAKLNGAHPMAAWRLYRDLSQSQLGRIARVSCSMVAHIEGRRKTGSAQAVYRLATALGVPMECIIDRRWSRV